MYIAKYITSEYGPIDVTLTHSDVTFDHVVDIMAGALKRLDQDNKTFEEIERGFSLSLSNGIYIGNTIMYNERLDSVMDEGDCVIIRKENNLYPRRWSTNGSFNNLFVARTVVNMSNMLSSIDDMLVDNSYILSNNVSPLSSLDNISSIFQRSTILNRTVSLYTTDPNIFTYNEEGKVKTLSEREYNELPERVILPNDSVDGLCIVCQCDFEVSDVVKTLPCNHIFHDDCIKTWLMKDSSTCPMCRYDLNGSQEQTVMTEQTVVLDD